MIALLSFTLSDYHLSTGALVGVFFIAILALNIVTGYTGQISIGQGAFMAFGGYTTAILTHDHGWNDLATLPVAALVGFGVGIVVGLPALRFHGVYLALTTFAVALAVPQIAKNYPNFTGGTEGLALPTHTGLWLYRTTWIDRGDHLRAGLADPARPNGACLPLGARQRDRGRLVRGDPLHVQDARLRASRRRSPPSPGRSTCWSTTS